VRRKYQRIHKPLKADEILAQRSAIPSVDSRKRASSNVADGVLEPASKKQRTNWVSKRDLQKLKGSLDEKSLLTSERLEDGHNAAVDLWSGDIAPKEELMFNYLEKPKPKVAPPTISHAPIPMTASGKPVKAVKAPKAGASYNPSFNDWDDLLTQEGQKVVDAEKKRLQAEREEAERAARIAAIASEDARGGRTDDESAWEGFESEYESTEWLNKKRPERKTPAQRNKIKRRKEAESQVLHQKKMADRKKQAQELEALERKAGMEQEGYTDQVALLEDAGDGSDSGDDSFLRRKRLRNVSIPEKNVEVVLPDELQESLRRLKPEGNLLNDRFRHLLVNGKVEARKPVLQPKKKRVTYTEKWTYKDFQIPV
jgi:nucleolar protein 53